MASPLLTQATAEDRLERFQLMVVRTGPAASLAEAARAILAEACAAVGADGGYVGRVCPAGRDGPDLVALAEWGLGPDALAGLGRIPLHAALPVAEAVRSGEPAWIASTPGSVLAPLPEVPPEAVATLERPRAWAVLPLRVRGQQVGGLAFRFPGPRSFPDDERDYLLAVAAYCAQVVDRSHALEELAERTEFYRTLAEETQELVSLTDFQGRIVYASPSYRAILGHDPAALVGADVLDLVHPDDRRDAVESGARQLAAGEAVRHSLRLRHADGSYRALEGRGAVVTIKGQRLILGVGRDVTARTEMELRLLEAHSQLKQAIAQRSIALGLVAHELRNPLTPMLLRIAALRSRADPELAASLDVLERSVLRIEELVGKVLDLSRSADGTLRLQRGPCDLAAVVREAVESLRPAAERDGLRLTLEAPASLPLSGDRSRLFQVAANLVGNAIKFNRPGGAVAVELAAAPGEAVLRVADTGQGFRPDQAGLLFRAFGRLDSGRPGIGLGLYLCRAIAELHGGRLEGRSDGPGRGATFEAFLPLREPEAGPPVAPLS